ncbi:polymer-forming cytoskeletal protein [Verrucomicrobiales bacterium]|nr:polymer-forming cytoskeletal protein [Verrucomicrobiales bacterium]
MRKGVAIPSPGLKVSGVVAERSAVEPKSQVSDKGSASEEKLDQSSEAWLVTSDEKTKGARSLPKQEETEEEETEISAGAFFGLVDEDDESATTPVVKKKKKDLEEGSMEALMESQSHSLTQAKGKMPPNFIPPEERKKRRDEPVTDYKVRCFRCYHTQFVSKFAKSTQCERCSAYIALANYDIKAVKCHTLRTRGDITIGRRGGLINNSEIACNNLTVSGAIDATADCSGNAVFRHSGTVRGQLFCRKLVIEKNCEVTFPDGVKTESADIMGSLSGDITASGKIRVGKAGKLDGNASAHEIEIKEGGTISGESTIDSDITTFLPLKKGFNPSIIG